MTGEPLPFTRTESSVRENKTKYRWVTEGPNCDVCNLMRGRVYALIVWWDTVVPGLHPNCDCRLEPVPDDTPESSLDFFGVEPWIDRLNFNTYTRWWIKRLMPWDITEVQALTEAYQQTGNWKDAFEKVKQITNPKSVFSNPRLTIYNTQHPLSHLFSWPDGFFTTWFDNCPIPSAWLPWERYR